VADHQRHHYPSSRVDVARSSPALASLRPTRSVGALYFFSGRFSRVAVVAHRSRVLRPAYTAAGSPLRPSLLVVRATLPSSDFFILFFVVFFISSLVSRALFFLITDVFYREFFFRPLVLIPVISISTTVLIGFNFHCVACECLYDFKL